MKKQLLLALALCSATLAQAKINLPSLLCDNMVLQQQTDARLWGSATPRSVVTITPSWSQKPVTVKADKNGQWKTTVATPAGGYTPYTMTITDGDGPATTLSNILVGEVWLASGQSNMQMPLKGFGGCPVQNGIDDALASAANKGVRMFIVPMEQKFEEQSDCGGSWLVANPQNSVDFSATAYYYATSVSTALGVPVGIVNSSYGGARVESWTNRALLEEYGTEKLTEDAIFSMEPHYYRPMVMYNAMFAPVKNYTYKGIIWYQGCSNVGAHQVFVERFSKMVALWRQQLSLGDIPFYYVEIAPYDYDSSDQDEQAPYLREAQFKAQSVIPNSAMICINDLVEPYERFNIHPRHKREVGQRLGYTALNKTYGMQQVFCDYPQYKGLTIKGNEAWVEFDHIGMGICRNYDIQGFEVAGEDRIFYPADDIVNNWQTNELIIKCSKVEKPVAVRYCFHDFQIGTLIGGNELPCIPFRTDEW